MSYSFIDRGSCIVTILFMILTLTRSGLRPRLAPRPSTSCMTGGFPLLGLSDMNTALRFAAQWPKAGLGSLGILRKEQKVKDNME